MEVVRTFWAMQACLLMIKPVILSCCLKLCRVFFLLELFFFSINLTANLLFFIYFYFYSHSFN
jgi:hypothetical protein